jgi:hypothetical protein
MIEGQSHYTKHDKHQPHLTKETLKELSHSSRIVGDADSPAMWSNSESQESVTEGRNNFIKMSDHERSKSRRW